MSYNVKKELKKDKRKDLDINGNNPAVAAFLAKLEADRKLNQTKTK